MTNAERFADAIERACADMESACRRCKHSGDTVDADTFDDAVFYVEQVAERIRRMEATRSSKGML